MKKHLTIGVAGHVDHGKTTLVRSLTGIDTDRLREEKERGLSIESGIAPFLLKDHLELAFVDVPGHTDYLKNTIRGLSAVDMAVLVVAANDGVMPQTIEHLRILELFQVKDGISVITKKDLVDEETLKLAELELKELTQGTFLEGKEIIHISSLTGDGITHLKRSLLSMAEALEPKDLNKPFRLWIDQLRTFPGFGTVVSGTILQGKVAEGDQIEILPLREITRIRSIESHHRRIKEAFAGQRIGISLAKAPKGLITRGMELCSPGHMGCYKFLNVHLKNLSTCNLVLKQHQKVKLYVGSGCFVAQIILLDREILYPSETAFAHLRLEAEVGVIPGDRFILTPMNQPVLLGGGVVLETAIAKVKVSQRQRTYETLSSLFESDYKSFLLSAIRSKGILRLENLLNSYLVDKDHLYKTVQELLRQSEIIEITPGNFLSSSLKQELKEDILETVNSILTENPIQVSVNKYEILDRISSKYLKNTKDIEVIEVLLSELVSENMLTIEEGCYITTEKSVTLPQHLEFLTHIIMEFSTKSHITPFSADTIWKVHGRKFDKNQIKKVLNYLRAKKLLVRVNDGRFLNVNSLEEIKKRILKTISAKGIFTIHDCKEAFGYGRTVAVPILEYLDRTGFTLRTEEGRIIRK